MNTHYLNGLPQEWTAIAEVFSALGRDTANDPAAL